MGRTGEMKQMVMVLPYFPPSNLTGGHRGRYFAMHLPKFGWQVKVLSVAPCYYEEKLDDELEAILPSDLQVIRTRAFPIRPLRLIGDVSIRAFWWHYRALCRLVKQEKIDLIYILIPPNYSAMLGPLIYHRFGIPYAIDFIDPWVHPWPASEALFSKAWLSYQLSRILEPIALRHVRFITAVAPGYYEGVIKRYSWIDASRCLPIPYGAEEQDFQYLDKHPRSPYLFKPCDGNLHIVYAGAMLPRAYSTLGALFEAIILLRKEYPSFAQKLRFHFIGTGSKLNDSRSFTIKPLAERCGLSNVILEYPARIPYVEALNHLKHASAVLVMGSSESHYTPSKVFQAVLSRRPVIAMLHAQSAAVNILKAANAGTLVTFDEENPANRCIDEIAQAIYKAINHSYSPQDINWEVLRVYSAEAMTAKLAEMLELALNNNV